MSSNDLDQPGMSDENAKLFAKYDFWQLYHRMAASHGWEFRPYVVALPNRYKTRHCTPQQYHSYCLKFNNAIRTKLRRTLDHLIHLPGFCQRKPAFIKNDLVHLEAFAYRAIAKRIFSQLGSALY